MSERFIFLEVTKQRSAAPEMGTRTVRVAHAEQAAALARVPRQRFHGDRGFDRRRHQLSLEYSARVMRIELPVRRGVRLRPSSHYPLTASPSYERQSK